MAAVEDTRGAGLDQATVVLRRLLQQANEDESLREYALSCLMHGNVWAATWPGTLDAVRTLTNGDREQAMPLFSGPDQLRTAAVRFGWMNPDGSLGSRTLSAREALTGALAQGVHFVVIDICAEYAVEFSLEEVADAMAKAAPPIDRTSPMRMDAPMARNQVSGPLSAAVAPTSTPPRRVRRANSGALLAGPFDAPGLGEMDLPFQERTTGMSVRPVAAERLDSMSTGEAASRVDAAPSAFMRQSGPPPAARTWKDSLPPLHDAAPDLPTGDVQLPAPQPEPKPIAALEAPVTVTHAEEKAPAQKPSKTLLGAAAALKNAVTKRTVAKPESAGAEAAAEGEATEPAREHGGLTAPDVALDDAVLKAVADALRLYPEVEWACEVSDGSSVPVIGVRIEPSFLKNVPAISAGILAAGASHGATVSVLVLSLAPQMREARTRGTLFFPWRKRSPTR